MYCYLTWHPLLLCRRRGWLKKKNEKARNTKRPCREKGSCMTSHCVQAMKYWKYFLFYICDSLLRFKHANSLLWWISKAHSSSSTYKHTDSFQFERVDSIAPSSFWRNWWRSPDYRELVAAELHRRPSPQLLKPQSNRHNVFRSDYIATWCWTSIEKVPPFGEAQFEGAEFPERTIN